MMQQIFLKVVSGERALFAHGGSMPLSILLDMRKPNRTAFKDLTWHHYRKSDLGMAQVTPSWSYFSDPGVPTLSRTRMAGTR